MNLCPYHLSKHYAVVFLFVLLGWTETSNAQNISLNAQQQAKLKQLIASSTEAGEYFKTIRKQADKALADKPDPIRKIESEGKLNSDPAKIRTRESVRDMRKMNSLAYAYVVTGQASYLQKTKEFLIAWAKVNRSQGDPIDDTNLEDAIEAFDLIQKEMHGEDKKAVEQWLRQVAEAEIKRGPAGYNNWNSHRLKIIGLVGFAINDAGFRTAAVEGYKTAVRKNLESDGSSIDYHQRDALHYHVYDIQPLLRLAIAAQMNGVSLYQHSENGASLPKSVSFLFPFCEGKHVHKEFVHSKVKFDQTRAKAGQSEYKAGHPWNPKGAAQVLTLNAFFEKEKSYAMLRKIGLSFREYPNWDAVLLEAQRAK